MPLHVLRVAMWQRGSWLLLLLTQRQSDSPLVCLHSCGTSAHHCLAEVTVPGANLGGVRARVCVRVCEGMIPIHRTCGLHNVTLLVDRKRWLLLGKKLDLSEHDHTGSWHPSCFSNRKCMRNNIFTDHIGNCFLCLRVCVRLCVFLTCLTKSLSIPLLEKDLQPQIQPLNLLSEPVISHCYATDGEPLLVLASASVLCTDC